MSKAKELNDRDVIVYVADRFVIGHDKRRIAFWAGDIDPTSWAPPYVLVVEIDDAIEATLS